MTLMTFVSVSCNISYAFAEDDGKWASDKSRLEALVNEGRCEEYWNLLWPWAKKGNYEARYYLSSLLISFPYGDRICSPGSHCDLVSTFYDSVVFAIHSSGYKKDKAFNNFADSLYEMFGFSRSVGGQKFLDCLKQKSPRDCAAVAVSENVVPSFEEYAYRIDSLIAKGAKSTCIRAKER